GAQEAGGVLEIARGRVGGERLCGRQRRSVAREHVADLPLRNGDQGVDVDLVLPRQQEVDATAQDGRLEAGFAVERDDAGRHRALAAGPLLDDADLRVRDVADSPKDVQRDHGGERVDKPVSQEGVDEPHGSPPRLRLYACERVRGPDYRWSPRAPFTR